MKVKTLMNKTVYSLGPDQNLRDAAQLMWEHDCGWAPVLDQNGIVEATITDRDIAMAAFLNDSRLADIPLAKAQSRSVITCSENDDIIAVEKIMQSEQLRRLPVLNKQQKLVGVIALNDIALAFNAGRRGVDAEGLSSTLAAICSHQHPQHSIAAVA